MTYLVMVTRPTEDPKAPTHQFRLTDDQGQPVEFADKEEAEAVLAQHLANFPADQAMVVPADQANTI